MNNFLLSGGLPNRANNSHLAIILGAAESRFEPLDLQGDMANLKEGHGIDGRRKTGLLG